MSLASVKDNDIIQELKTMLEAIEEGDDYRHTPDAVFDNFPEIAAYNEDESYVINLRDVSDENSLESISDDSLHDIALGVEIDIVTRSYTPAQVREMKADILKAIGADLTIGGNAFHTRYLGAQKNKRDAYGQVITGWTIMIEIHYRKIAWSAS